eukprot:4797969-Prymnesium_polylepis.4
MGRHRKNCRIGTPWFVGACLGMRSRPKTAETAPPTHRYDHNMADNVPSRTVIAPVRSDLAHHATVRAVQTTPPPNQTHEPN